MLSTDVWSKADVAEVQRKSLETVKPEQILQESSNSRTTCDLASSAEAQLKLQMFPSSLPFSVNREWKDKYILRVNS